MKNLKKTFGLMGVTLFAGTLLVACGSGKANNSDSGETQDGKVELRMSWWGNDDRHKDTLAAIKKFEEANPNITVKAEYSGWDGIVEKMATQIAGGTEADVMQMNYDWYTTYSKDGNGFANLNDYSDIIDLSGYTDETLSAGTIDGKLNGVPHGENSYVFGLNKTKYAEFGIDINDLKTWDDYYAAADQFPEGYYPLSFKSFNEPMIYLTQKYGKAFMDNEGNINYSEKQLTEGLEWYQSLMDKKVIPTAKEMTETVGTSHLSTVKEFIDGKYDGAPDWTGGLASYSAALKENGMELVIPTFPTIEEGQKAGVIKKPSMLFSISKNSKHPEEAAKFLNFLLNDPDGVKALGTSRGLPVNTKALEILEDAGQVDELSKSAAEFTKNTEGIIESPYYEMSQVVEAYKGPFEEFGMGQASAKEAAKAIIENTEAAVEEIKAQ